MPALNHVKLLLVGGVCFVAGYIAATTQPHSAAEPLPPAKTAPPFPLEARLGANLFQQTAAEYQACCLTIYRSAETRLATILQTARPRPARPAVVMDLDETVLDNSRFESFLYKYRLEYTDALWDVYEGGFPKDAALVPGAKPFIDWAESQGVTVVYISNRSEPFREETVEALRHNGLNVADINSRLFLKARDGTSDKSSRRDVVSARFNVLMYFGDNLRDFSEVFVARKVPKDAKPAVFQEAIRERYAAVDAATIHWGVDWFVLPNPVYGEWEKLLGADPKARLRPTDIVPPKKPGD